MTAARNEARGSLPNNQVALSATIRTTCGKDWPVSRAATQDIQSHLT
jgi:hypothetical protein